MAYTCGTCETDFRSAAGLTQHVALHHNTCAECDETFDDTDGLRDHIHDEH
ncbi:C2H2-type zinc finger protein [Haloferacaceae archaeon DSL9]